MTSYGARGLRAFSRGAFEICISPVNGWFNSRIKKRANDADAEKTQLVVTTIKSGRTNKLKLAKIMASQIINIAKKGVGIGLAACSSSSRRVCTRSFVT